MKITIEGPHPEVCKLCNLAVGELLTMSAINGIYMKIMELHSTNISLVDLATGVARECDKSKEDMKVSHYDGRLTAWKAHRD